MQLQIWSDIACPWCWVGKKNLEAALAQFDHPAQVVWRAFELNPEAPATPPQPVDYVGRLASKYGMGRQDAQAFIDRMTQAGKSVGVDFRFDRIRPCNTFQAHRLLAWAHTLGPGRQDALKERFFEAYMHQGLDLNDPDTLSRLASEVGLDADAATAVLGDGSFADEVRADQTTARALGITGVPFFVFGPGIAASGAQPPATLLDALKQAHKLQTTEAAASSTVDGAPGVCGVDGCD